MINIVKKLVSDNQKTSYKKIHEALWVDRVTPKREIGISPFELVYETKANLTVPLELATNKLRMVIEDDIYKDGLEKRILYLTNLEEEREEIVDHITQHQMRVKDLFDKNTRPQKFIVGDSVLLWDK